MPPLLNPHLEGLQPYVPGEQINAPDVIKLNSNECPFPPSERVIEAIQGALGALRKYPNPTARPLREAIARDLGLDPRQAIVGNGSDEILRLIFHAYAPAGARIATLAPTYSLYPILGQMFGGTIEEHPADIDEPLPASFVASDAPIKFLPNPNPPYGIQYAPEAVRALVEASRLVVLDEAYVDFADWNGAAWVKEYDNLLVTRTFSKSHALAGLRVGFGIGAPRLIETLHAIRDSYNVNVVSQAAALAAWHDRAWLAATVAKTTHLRDFLAEQLRALGFRVGPSAGNFLFAEHALGEELASHLKTKNILVRHFRHPGLRPGIRISIGTEAELQALLRGVQIWLSSHGTVSGANVPA